MNHELAQVNVARLAAPLESAQLLPFVEALDRVNAEAEGAPGFRWRLQSDSDGANVGATDVVAFQWDHTEADSGVIVNLSVWADAASLRAFVFGGDHVNYLRRRREWFLPMKESYAVCWWVEAGHQPSTDEAEERVRHRREHGATAHAFDLKDPYPPPG
jgi:hypothetical protein